MREVRVGCDANRILAGPTGSASRGISAESEVKRFIN